MKTHCFNKVSINSMHIAVELDARTINGLKFCRVYSLLPFACAFAKLLVIPLEYGVKTNQWLTKDGNMLNARIFDMPNICFHWRVDKSDEYHES